MNPADDKLANADVCGSARACDPAVEVAMPFWQQAEVTGAGLGLLAAVAYTVANLGLRSVAPGGDLDWAIFVSAMKAFPVSAIAWTLVLWRMGRGEPGLPPRPLVVPLLITGFIMQFGGNTMFQYALSQGGLALTVPLTFSTILLSGGLLGRCLLGEAITWRLLVAMGTMMAAVAVLSQGAERASHAVVLDPNWWSTVRAVGSACLSGLAYGTCGVMIRRCATRNVSYAATIVFISSIGPCVLGPLAVSRLGMASLTSLPADVWWRMLGAGLANAVAFFSVNAAYKRLSVVRVNLLNASQTAMAAMAGVVLFGEPNTGWLQAGTALTILGLLLSARRERRAPAASAFPPPAGSVLTPSTIVLNPSAANDH